MEMQEALARETGRIREDLLEVLAPVLLTAGAGAGLGPSPQPIAAVPAEISPERTMLAAGRTVSARVRLPNNDGLLIYSSTGPETFQLVLETTYGTRKVLYRKDEP